MIIRTAMEVDLGNGRKEYVDSKVCNIIREEGYADAIEEFDRICEEVRSYKFGTCLADFVIDVIKAKVKEQLKRE